MSWFTPSALLSSESPLTTPVPSTPPLTPLVIEWARHAIPEQQSLCAVSCAWLYLDSTMSNLSMLARGIEMELEAADVHSSPLWFAWGLFDVHVQALIKVVEDHHTSAICMELEPALFELESDIRHIIASAEQHALEPDANDRVLELCLTRGRALLESAFEAHRTIDAFDVVRRKRRLD